MPEVSLDCFLLTRHWRDSAAGLELSFWACSPAGPLRVVVEGESAVAFVPRGARLPPGVDGNPRIRRRPLALRDLDGGAVDGLYFHAQRDLAQARERLRRQGAGIFESDVKPSDRYLMERFVTAAFHARGPARDCGAWLELRNPGIRQARYRPRFRQVALDIETSGFDGRLYSIAASGEGGQRVFLVSERDLEAPGVDLVCCRDEREALQRFFQWMERADPDLILGWNVLDFDLDFLERRCGAAGIPFALGRGGERARILQPRSRSGVRVARLPGRVPLDGIDLLRAGFRSFESFELEHVARALLGRGKRLLAAGEDRLAEIRRLYREDPVELARYNLEDCRLVEAIFEHAGLVDFAMRRAEITGLPMDRMGGSVAAFDHLYLPRLHRRGRVARDVGDAPGDSRGSPGGYVLDSRPGLYEDVLLLDFKSLYPSIIRTFRIDPCGMADPGADPVPGFEGASFAREGTILPELVAGLWEVRDAAKRAGDAALSQTVKILMNSLYGVLGAYGCRFFDSRLTSSITLRGHEIIRKSRDFIEARGYPVLYGDTDSLFLLLGRADGEERAAETGAGLAAALGAWWREEIARAYRLESFLEVEFEAHFLRFLMPTVRGEQTGSKKRYAGLVRAENGEPEVVFKGLESVRTDWTPLARGFQRELYRRVFLNEPFEEYVREVLEDLLAGRLDEQLVYRKRLRRPVGEYTRNVPPHVQAAAKLARPGRWVRYVVTRGGPEPVPGAAPPVPDYQHYRERQLAPVANGILHFLGTSFERITDAQMRIF